VRGPLPGTDTTCDLSQWNHCTDRKAIDDIVLKGAWQTGVISFVFCHRSHDEQRKTV